MIQKNANLSRADKIMLTIYEMGGGKKGSLKFEDIVVAVFKKFPEDFHLRGYAEYPDSGDLVHKPLYDFRKKGYLEASNKVFSLTDRGIDFAKRLIDFVQGKNVISDGRLSRYAEKEISRIESLEAFLLFLDNKSERITDTDFYTYLGVSPRTSKNDFLGRLKTLQDAIQELSQQKKINIARNRILEYHKYMMEKFSSIIDHFKIIK
jgi:hypothetical protein